MPEVCEAICKIYKDEELKCPSTPHEGRDNAHQFGQRWKYQHAVVDMWPLDIPGSEGANISTTRVSTQW